MNGKVNDGAKTVHAAGLQDRHDFPYPLCQPGGRYRLHYRTSMRVTCKKCLKFLRREGKP
jgi:hypothetical protein